MKKAGFTLIESCLVLLIAAMVIAIGIFVMTFTLCNFAENLIKVTALDFKHWVVVVILAFMVIPIDLIRKIIEKKRENK